MPIKLIISDVDGCLLPEESVAWDAEKLGPLAEWCRRSARGQEGLPQLTLCTGRPQPYVEALMKLLDIRLPAICESGAVFYDLAHNRARYGEGVEPGQLRLLHRLQEWLEEELLPGHPGCLLQFGKMAQLSVFNATEGGVGPLAEAVRQRGAELGLALDVHPSVYYLNISLKTATKGHAVEQLLRELEVPVSEVAAIGDTEGDMPLRDHAAFFACPANARPALKKVADYVSPYALQDGVLDILERLPG